MMALTGQHRPVLAFARMTSEGARMTRCGLEDTSESTQKGSRSSKNVLYALSSSALAHATLATVMPRRKRSLQGHLKHAFIPHKGNGYHPHVLREHHLIGHAAAFTALKVGFVLFATLIPNAAFLAPNVLTEQARKIVMLTNAMREEKGLSELSVQSMLIGSAQNRADDMSDKEYFSHVSPDGKRLNWFLGRAGYPYREAGENLAMGFSDADSAMNGWTKSPTHYANLVDNAFEEIGVGVHAGIFQEKPTIFLVQHFGTQVKAEEPAVPVVEPKNQHTTPSIPSEGPIVAVAKPMPATAPVAVASVRPNPATPKEVVTLVARVTKPSETPTPAQAPVTASAPPEAAPTPAPIVVASAPVQPEAPSVAPIVTYQAPVVESGPALEPISYNADDSLVRWQEVGGHVRADVLVYAKGDVASAQAFVSGSIVKLTGDGEGHWVGSISLPQSPDELFRVVIPPTVRLVSSSGQVVQATVMWQNPKVVTETPWGRYVQAKSWLSSSMPVFSIVRWLFLIGGGFFAFALLVNLLVKVIRDHKQHPHVALQTAALIGMLLLYAKW